MLKKNLLKLGVSIAVCQLAGVLGLFVTQPDRDPWFQQLQKPVFNPPNWVFPVIWPILYTLMGTSLFLVWKKRADGRDLKPALLPFSVQWLLNALWSPIFFGLKEPLYALVDLVGLWGAVIWTITQFWRFSRPAAWLLLPYWLWVSFAGLLNGTIWWLNRG